MVNRWGKGKGDGEEGGEVSTQAARDQSGRESHHDPKEGFQVSKRGSGTGEGFFRQRGVIKRIVPCTSDIIPILYISC
jgi:hypothetical protein